MEPPKVQGGTQVFLELQETNKTYAQCKQQSHVKRHK